MIFIPAVGYGTAGDVDGTSFVCIESLVSSELCKN